MFLTDLLSHDIFQGFVMFGILLVGMIAMFSGNIGQFMMVMIFGFTVINAPSMFEILLDLDEKAKPENPVVSPSPLSGMFDGFLGVLWTTLTYALWAVLAGVILLVLVKGVSLYRNFEFRVQLFQFAFRVLHWKFGIKDPYAHLTVYLHKPEVPYEPLSFPEMDEAPIIHDKS